MESKHFLFSLLFVVATIEKEVFIYSFMHQGLGREKLADISIFIGYGFGR